MANKVVYINDFMLPSEKKYGDLDNFPFGENNRQNAVILTKFWNFEGSSTNSGAVLKNKFRAPRCWSDPSK